MFGKVYYKVTGLNFDKFLKLLKKENIQTFKLQRLDYNIFTIGVKKQDENVFVEIAQKMNYTISNKQQTLLPKALQNIKQNLAFVLSLVFISIILCISCNMVYKVEVFGLENVSKNQVLQVLNKNGYTTGKLKATYNLSKLETVLKQNINNISFASAIIKGNTLVINVNEKIDNSNLIYDYKPIISPYNMVIKEVNLKSGTALVHSGDVVKKGDVLISPYIESKDGTKLKVEASAEIKAYAELSNTITYLENHIEFVRSGKKLEQNQFSLFGLNLGIRGKKLNFKNYQAEVSSTFNFKNFFLPIKQTKTIYYELIEKQVFVPFNKVVQNLIEENQNLLYNNLSAKVVENVSYETTTLLINNTHIVTTILKADVTL